jgi:hypothetical protein
MAAKCSFRGCTNNVYSGGLCNGHYTQQYRGKKLTPLSPRREALPVENGKKKCRECKKTKPVSEFYVTGKKSRGQNKYSTYCKPCYSKKVTDARKK